MLFMGMVFCVFSSFIHAQDSSIEIEKIKPPPGDIKDVLKLLEQSKPDLTQIEKASVNQVLSMDLTDRKVIMFSTYGLVPGELAGLTQPVLALSLTDITGDKDDGLLNMDKIISLKLNAD
jgi:hypothetical protein